ncbi:MAG: DegT/DnrJ/EryC1/StrS family aminotransferase [Cyclobacteriaceae bacterium]|nr:DegT/DnrJ/EryC1/StrS family aminotransferase [Cyclobacteriaceae bacterium HetDA_MAG_MS6]
MHESIIDELDRSISQVISKSEYILGEEVDRFESSFAKYLDVKHCITCGNGTDALELSLQILKVRSGDEVIVPALGWISSALAIQKTGAKPVFVDVEKDSGNIDPDEVEKKLTKRTKGIVGIHLFGTPFDVRSIRRICDDNDLFLLEDCAQAHGAEVDGTKVGSFGDVSVFSFYPTKNLGCLGDGGAVVTNNDELAQKIKSLRNYGKLEDGFVSFGRNSRLDEIQAAILNVKLQYIDQWNEQRKKIAAIYRTGLENRFSFLAAENAVYYRFHILSKRRRQIADGLRKAGVEVKTSNILVAAEPVFSVKEKFPQASFLDEHLIALPLFIGIDDKALNLCLQHLNKH